MLPSKQETGSSSSAMNTLPLFLGLYLILLCFFIFLNSIAELSAERTEQTTQSVQETFRLKKMPVGLMPTLQRNQEQAAQDIFGTAERLFENTPGLTKNDVHKLEQRMELHVPMTLLFEPGTLYVRAEQSAFLESMAQLMTTQSQDMYVQAEVLVQGQKTDADPRDKDMSLESFLGRRATLLVRALIENGVPARYLVAASEPLLNPRAASRVRFMLHLKPEAAAEKERYQSQHPDEEAQAEAVHD